MFSLLGKSSRLCDGMTRRECLRVGGLSLGGLTFGSLGSGFMGISLADLLRSQATAATGDRQFGKAKNVIFLWLQGGPPQHETFDPKPNAPKEIRGEFKPISTNIPGIQLSELLPRTAAMADKYAVVRSLVTDSNIHSASGYYVLTGYPYQGPSPRQISITDWPYFGSIVKMLKPSEKISGYSTVWLPDSMRLNDNVMPAGQTAGFLGKKWEPEKVIWDPSDPESQIEKFKLPADVSRTRLHARQSLLQQVDQRFQAVGQSGTLAEYGDDVQEAFSVLTTGKAFSAFDIEREPKRVRDRYGRSKWGQCVLLARRLVEAGVRLVHVNWVREDGDNAVDNPMWDTHANNADRLQDVLCPQFDIGFTALLEDLEQRGLLDETLVVAVGEFGRTPKINANGGRDHWGKVSNFLIAGAGIQSAQVIGRTDAIGGEPVADRIEPQNLTATIFHLLGIHHDVMFRDRMDRPHHATKGMPIHQLLGSGPATAKRTKAEGDLAFVPSYTTDKLRNTNFEDDVPLHPIEPGKRILGWQAEALTQGVVARRERFETGKPTQQKASYNVVLGIDLSDDKSEFQIRQGAKAILTQEIRNPRSGQFSLTVTGCGQASSQAFFDDVFLKHFSFGLKIFRYAETTKNFHKAHALGAMKFTPTYSKSNAPDWQRFELSKFLGTKQANANFAIGNGIGIAILVEKTSPGVLTLAKNPRPMALLRINEVQLDFVGKKRLANQT